MALKRNRGLRSEEGIVVKDTNMSGITQEGVLVTYVQATDSISSAADLTYNAITTSTAFGSEGKRAILIEAFEPNEEYWVILGGTVTKGDLLGSDASGHGVHDATGAGALIAMSSGITGQYIVAQKHLI